MLYGPHYSKAKELESKYVYNITRTLGKLHINLKENYPEKSPGRRIANNLDVIKTRLREDISRPLFTNAYNSDAKIRGEEKLPVVIGKEHVKMLDGYMSGVRQKIPLYYREARQKYKPDEFITQNNAEGEFYLSENTGDENIFEFSDTNDPMLSDSTFNNHRLAVIRKSIETNLNAVISSYQNTALYEYEMPIMSSQDWYKILNNVSVVSYMQGMPMAGYRYYNNYAVITNNVNKEVVTNENIYIVTKEDGTNNREYHLPGCKELIDGVNNGSLSIIGAYSTASFQRQTVKISENNEKHFYFQSRVGVTLTSCYNCVVNATGNYSADDIIKGEIRHYEDKNVLYDKDDLKEIRTAYLKALAREKYNLYKTNFDLGN